MKSGSECGVRGAGSLQLIFRDGRGKKMSDGRAETLQIMLALWRARFRHAIEVDLVLPRGEGEPYVFQERSTANAALTELIVSPAILELPREVALSLFRGAIEEAMAAPDHRLTMALPSRSDQRTRDVELTVAGARRLDRDEGS
jgi:hypothetical protein